MCGCAFERNTEREREREREEEVVATLETSPYTPSPARVLVELFRVSGSGFRFRVLVLGYEPLLRQVRVLLRCRYQDA